MIFRNWSLRVFLFMLCFILVLIANLVGLVTFYSNFFCHTLNLQTDLYKRRWWKSMLIVINLNMIWWYYSWVFFPLLRCDHMCGQACNSRVPPIKIYDNTDSIIQESANPLLHFLFFNFNSGFISSQLAGNISHFQFKLGESDSGYNLLSNH